MKLLSTPGLLGTALLLSILSGCQPTVYLMPTPEAFKSGLHDPFSKDAELDTRNHIVYATNRIAVGPKENRQHLTLFDDQIRVGVARIRIGAEGKSWAQLRAISTTEQRLDNVPLTLEKASEKLTISSIEEPLELTAAGRAFFDRLNAALARNMDPDLILYVHGANNNFYRASAQASQLRHFSGRNSVVMLYAWPSAESLLRYAVDVNNARKTVPVFARLLELLAKYSNARYIDILTYSAGAQVVSPALASLREKHGERDISDLKGRLRLGEVYFAAPDVDFVRFLEDMATYIDLPSHVTLAINPDDSVLAFASRHHGVSRAGRPDGTELGADETRWVLNATRDLPFDVIWIDPQTLPGMSKGAHDFWYSHPWVSTDVLVQLLFQARPQDRGLEALDNEDEARLWYYPPDYPERITPAINRLMQQALESAPDEENSKPVQ